MSTRPAHRVGVFLVELALLLTACGGSDEAIETSTTVALTTATEAIEAVSMSLTFDGESCKYDGPTELTAGPVQLTFFNESDGTAAVNLLELLEGKTIQDVIEYNGPEPSTKHAPSWTRDLGTWRSVPTGASQQWEGDLEPASYFMVCALLSPLGVWLGTGLTVEGDPTN